MAGVWYERRSGTKRHRDDVRSDHELDYARIVHAGSFRRLQGKTQILSLGDDDFYRTRLTHSLEVAQVAEGILQHLRATDEGRSLADWLPSDALVRALGLAHDIGHPPFGHGGELALNYCMRDNGGFEGNAQTLRLLARLEAYTRDNGADLSRRTLLGLLKYPAPRASVANPEIVPRLASTPTTIAVINEESAKPAKACYDCDSDVLDWILAPLSSAERELMLSVEARPAGHGRTLHKSFDCSIMDAADDIAYGVHDLEDAVALGLISEAQFRDGVPSAICESFVDLLASRPLEGIRSSFDGMTAGLFGNAGCRKRLIGRLVHYCISSTIITAHEKFSDPLLRHRLDMQGAPKALLAALRDLISAKVIRSPRVQHADFKGQRMVVACFEALASSPEQLLPRSTYNEFGAKGGDLRPISDHLACMTDASLLRLYDRLFSPRMGSIFEPA